MTILDLGCHEGETLEIYADMFPEADIFGFELNPVTAGIARKRVERFGDRVTVFNTAVGYPARKASTYLQNDQRDHLIPGDDIDVFTIDEILNFFYFDIVDFMKMDIEGEEIAILKGGGEWTKRVKTLLVEVHVDPVSDAVDLLTQLGYAVEPRLSDPTWKNHLWCKLIQN